jgi:hypothetical protein
MTPVAKPYATSIATDSTPALESIRSTDALKLRPRSIDMSVSALVYD